MNCADLLDYFKSKTAIASAIGVKHQHVYGWFLRDAVPIEQQMKFEVLTCGALRADINPEFRNFVAGKKRTAA